MLTFCADGQILIGTVLSSGHGRYLARAWSVSQGEQLADFTLPPARGVNTYMPSTGHTPCAVTPDGRFLATANSYRDDNPRDPVNYHIRLRPFLAEEGVSDGPGTARPG
jgi:hypothetical protein